MKVSRPKKSSKKGGNQKATPITKMNYQQQTSKRNVKPPSTEEVSYLSPCARDYVRALANPFQGPLACVPSQTPNKTLKVRVFTRGSFFTGTSGIGFIAVDPTNSCFNDVPCVLKTNATFAGNTFNLNDTVSGAIDQAFSNSNYVSTDVALGGDGIAFRIVSSGVRIRYAGTELNRGGFATCLHDPTHTVLTGRDQSSIDGEPMSRRIHIKEDWINILYAPVFGQDYDLRTAFANADPPTIGALPRWYMGALITAPTNTPAPFEYEFFSIIEYQGRNVRGLSMSHADPTALSAGASVAIANTPSRRPSVEIENDFLHKAYDYVRYGISHVENVVKTGAKVYNTYNALRQSSMGIPTMEDLALEFWER